MGKPISWYVLVVSAAASGACQLPGSMDCSTDARPAVSVDVRDSVTGAPAGRGARIIARDGAFVDTSMHTGQFDGPYALARERAGTYSLTVEQDGYQLWSRAGVRVTRDECHVRTVSLVARLQR